MINSAGRLKFKLCRLTFDTMFLVVEDNYSVKLDWETEHLPLIMTWLNRFILEFCNSSTKEK